MSVRIITGDALEQLRLLPSESVHCCVTSPPYYGLRDYGVTRQIGLEPSPDQYIAALVAVFREVRRVLRSDGTLWLNIGDSYHNYRVHKDGGQPPQGFHGDRHGQPETGGRNRGTRIVGIKEKDLIGIPWMLAFALRADGWWLRQDIIWAKPNPMPESVTDRCTKAHEYLFLLSRNERYWFDAAAIAEPTTRPELIGATRNYVPPDRRLPTESRTDGRRDVPYGAIRNKRSVWTVTTNPYAEAHFATFPPALIEPCILAGCPAGGAVLDPFGGAGTTGLVADRLGRDAVLIELNPLYAGISERRIYRDGPLFADVAIDPMELTDAAE